MGRRSHVQKRRMNGCGPLLIWILIFVFLSPTTCRNHGQNSLRPKKTGGNGRSPQQEREKQEKEKKRKERGIDVPPYERLFWASVPQVSSTNPIKVNQGKSEEPSSVDIKDDNFSFGVEGFGLYGSGNINSESVPHCDEEVPEFSQRPLFKGKRLQRHLECAFCNYMNLSSDYMSMVVLKQKR